MLRYIRAILEKRHLKRVRADMVMWLKLERTCVRLKESMLEYEKGVRRYQQMKDRIRYNVVGDEEIAAMERYQVLLHNHRAKLANEARAITVIYPRRVIPDDIQELAQISHTFDIIIKPRFV